MIWLWSVGSALIVSLIAVVVALPLLAKKNISNHVLLVLLSLSIGTFLGAVFLMLLPEAVGEGYTALTAVSIFLGFLTFFIIEKIVHYNHRFKCKHPHPGHSHAYHLAPMTLIGDGLHNFVDGIAMAASYAVSIPFGIASTLAIIMHELPQEIADIGVLLHSKMSVKKIILFNGLSGATAIVGAILGVIFIGRFQGFHGFIIPYIAGVFLYIAAADLVPELHKHCGIRETILHILSIILGLLLIYLVTIIGPAHLH